MADQFLEEISHMVIQLKNESNYLSTIKLLIFATVSSGYSNGNM